MNLEQQLESIFDRLDNIEKGMTAMQVNAGSVNTDEFEKLQAQVDRISPTALNGTRNKRNTRV